ncbi:unnamed protein product [Amaranthus hypochondriacus]
MHATLNKIFINNALMFFPFSFNESKGSYKLTRKIKEIFETIVDEGAGRWTLVKQETRDYCFGEFQVRKIFF